MPEPLSRLVRAVDADNRGCWVDPAVPVAAAAVAFWRILVSRFCTATTPTSCRPPTPGGFWRMRSNASPAGTDSSFARSDSYLTGSTTGGRKAMPLAGTCGAWHAVNTCLVYLLVRRLGRRRAAAFVAALLAALHGSRAKTVAWPDARFDLLATFFALCAVLDVLEHCRTGRRLFYVPLAVCAALAVYTKASAFCLPLLPAAPLCLPPAQWRRAIAASLAFGGIGGYMPTARASARSGNHGRCTPQKRYPSGNGPSPFCR